MLIHPVAATATRPRSTCWRRPLQPARGNLLCAAFQQQYGDQQPTGAAQAREVLQELLRHFSSRHMGNIVPYLPSREVSRSLDMLPAAMRMQQGSNPAVFEKVVDNMLHQNPSEHFLDSYALRNLVVSAPASYQELSSMMVGTNTWICRQIVQANTGEEAVLTFTLKRNHSPQELSHINDRPVSQYDTSVSGALPPLQGGPSYTSGMQETHTSTQHTTPTGSGQGASTAGAGPPAGYSSDQPAEADLHVDPAPMGVGGTVRQEMEGSMEHTAERTVQTPPAWRLACVRGEPRHTLLPRSPSPEFSPESVVQAQLEALQQYDFSQAYALLSPAAQTLVGPLDRYIHSMGRSRLYRPLVAHRSATSLRRCQHSANTYLEVVAVQGLRTPEEVMHKSSQDVALYCWIVTKQEEPGPLKDCWLTEWVKVVDDPKLRHVLGLPASKQREQDDGEGRRQ